MHQVRIRIAKAFQMGVNDYYIKTNSGPLRETFYESQLKDLAVGKILRICRETSLAHHPRHILANDMKLVTQLIRLLVCDSKGKLVEAEALAILETLPVNTTVREFLLEHLRSRAPQQPDRWL